MSASWSSKYEGLLDLVSALMAMAEPDAAWGLLGDHLLNTHFDAEVFTVNQVSANAGASQVPYSTPGWVASRVPPADELHELFSNHPLVQHLANAPDRMAPRRCSDAVALSVWRNSATRAQLKEALGISHQLAIPLPPLGGSLRTAVLMRPGHDFTDLDLARATRLQRLLIGVDLHLRLTGPLSGRRDGAGPIRLGGGVRLTQREISVLGLLGDGLTADSIARRLGVSNRTVHKHLEHLYAKLDRSDRLSAVLQAQRLGILPGPERPS